MCLYPLFLSIPTISISRLSAVLSFLKIFSTGRSGSTKLLPITDYHISIFPWTPKGFTSPESFLNFLLNLYIPPWLRKSFKQNLRLIVLRLLQIHVWRLSMWQFETRLFASSNIWLANISEARYSTLVTSVSKKLNVDQSELEK